MTGTNSVELTPQSISSEYPNSFRHFRGRLKLVLIRDGRECHTLRERVHSTLQAFLIGVVTAMQTPEKLATLRGKWQQRSTEDLNRLPHGVLPCNFQISKVDTTQHDRLDAVKNMRLCPAVFYARYWSKVCFQDEVPRNVLVPTNAFKQIHGFLIRYSSNIGATRYHCCEASVERCAAHESSIAS